MFTWGYSINEGRSWGSEEGTRPRSPSPYLPESSEEPRGQGQLLNPFPEEETQPQREGTTPGEATEPGSSGAKVGAGEGALLAASHRRARVLSPAPFGALGRWHRITNRPLTTGLNPSAFLSCFYP